MPAKVEQETLKKPLALSIYQELLTQLDSTRLYSTLESCSLRSLQLACDASICASLLTLQAIDLISPQVDIAGTVAGTSPPPLLHLHFPTSLPPLAIFISALPKEQEAFSRLFGTNSILQLSPSFFCSSQH